jgi:type II secretory pathway component PulC
MRSIVTVAAMALGLGLAGIQTSSAAPVTTTPEATRPPLVLVGTVVGEFRQIGIFVEETTKEAVRLATGEGYDGWVVRSVDKAGVQFERGQLTATVMLRPDKSPRSAAIPTAELIPPVRHRKL